MRRIIINPSGDEQKDLIQDLIIDLVLGSFGFLGLLLTTVWVFRYLVGCSLLDPMNLLFILLGVATLVTMIRIHRETAMPGEGYFWMTKRTFVGAFFHCFVYGYALFLMGIAFDIPYFRQFPVWAYNFVLELL
jgi:hypothetical protein